MAPTVAQAKREKDWQGEDDARTLAQADIIKNDRSRFSTAKKKAKTMANDQMKQASAMKKVAGSKATTTTRKPATRRKPATAKKTTAKGRKR